MKYVWYVICACTLFPSIVRANVVINEIAWMGTAVSANDEWIELFNDSVEAVDVSGWVLRAEDGEPSVTLSGIIEAGGFFLLERTDDLSVPDVTADQIYSGNMANTGETLVLTAASGTTTDTVSGGADWGTIGGNNTTKHTAQRQPDGTWITGVPTPRAENSTEDTGADSGSSGGSSSGGSKTTAPKITGGYRQNVFVYAGEDMTGVVGADVFFEGYVVDENNKSIEKGSLFWSFGDGARRYGNRVAHVYHEPGTYTVVLEVHAGNQKNEDTLLVRVFPPDITITNVVFGEDGYVEIKNNSVEEVDISDWQIWSRRYEQERRLKKFVFSDNVRIAARTAVRFSEAVLNLNMLAGDSVMLLYPNSKEVTRYAPPLVTEKSAPVISEIPVSATVMLEEQDVFQNEEESEEPLQSATTSTTTLFTTSSAAIIGSLENDTGGTKNSVMFTLLGSVLVALVGVVVWHKIQSVRLDDGIEISGEHILPSEFSITEVTPKDS